MATRKPAVKIDPAKLIQAERQRAADAKKNVTAKRAAAKQAKKDQEAIAAAEAEAQRKAEEEKRQLEYAVNRLKALSEDFNALNEGREWASDDEKQAAMAAYFAEQGIALDGGTIDPADKPKDGQKYNGPMLALVSARKTYIKAPNGILCNGDRLALICGAHTREQTVKALIVALKLPGNPYLTLNPGQQSMNLRNKARHALKNGTLTITEIEAAFKGV